MDWMFVYWIWGVKRYGVIGYLSIMYEVVLLVLDKGMELFDIM